jgi:hypothetical protein
LKVYPGHAGMYFIKFGLKFINIGTLAFKALLLNGQKKVTEANDLLKLTLMKNMKNFTVWHVYGLLKKN